MTSSKKLSQHALAEFKTIYEEEFGETLSDDHAAEIATRLLRLFYLLSNQPVDPVH